MQRRNTGQRLCILNEVLASCTHPTAEEIYEKVLEAFPHVSLTTVYRNLNVLADEGLIRRITIPNEPDRFDKTVRAHHHIFCEKCGRFEDVEIPYQTEADTLAGQLTGFHVNEHLTLFHGICKECQSK